MTLCSQPPNVQFFRTTYKKKYIRTTHNRNLTYEHEKKDDEKKIIIKNNITSQINHIPRIRQKGYGNGKCQGMDLGDSKDS